MRSSTCLGHRNALMDILNSMAREYSKEAPPSFAGSDGSLPDTFDGHPWPGGAYTRGRLASPLPAGMLGGGPHVDLLAPSPRLLLKPLDVPDTPAPVARLLEVPAQAVLRPFVHCVGAAEVDPLLRSKAN